MQVRTTANKTLRLGFSTSSASVDRKSTRLNSSHLVISYAVFCLKKKKKQFPRLFPLRPLLPIDPSSSRLRHLCLFGSGPGRHTRRPVRVTLCCSSVLSYIDYIAS